LVPPSYLVPLEACQRHDLLDASTTQDLTQQPIPAQSTAATSSGANVLRRSHAKQATVKSVEVALYLRGVLAIAAAGAASLGFIKREKQLK
jgi:hypothetical protein